MLHATSVEHVTKAEMQVMQQANARVMAHERELHQHAGLRFEQVIQEQEAMLAQRFHQHEANTQASAEEMDALEELHAQRVPTRAFASRQEQLVLNSSHISISTPNNL